MTETNTDRLPIGLETSIVGDKLESSGHQPGCCHCPQHNTWSWWTVSVGARQLVVEHSLFQPKFGIDGTKTAKYHSYQNSSRKSSGESPNPEYLQILFFPENVIKPAKI